MQVIKNDFTWGAYNFGRLDSALLNREQLEFQAHVLKEFHSIMRLLGYTEVLWLPYFKKVIGYEGKDYGNLKLEGIKAQIIAEAIDEFKFSGMS